ncbi:MAG: hypothetical protein RPR97_16230, partial [Colwellia sp.]
SHQKRAVLATAQKKQGGKIKYRGFVPIPSKSALNEVNTLTHLYFKGLQCDLDRHTSDWAYYQTKITRNI